MVRHRSRRHRPYHWYRRETLMKTLRLAWNMFVGVFIGATLVLAVVGLNDLLRIPTPNTPIIMEWTQVDAIAHSVVKMWNEDGAGTGFQVLAPSGKSYLLTNQHVCDTMASKMTVKNYRGRNLVRKIVAISDHADLCLLEPYPGLEPLALGYAAEPGLYLIVIGHANGGRTTAQAGILYGYGLVETKEPLPAEGRCDLFGEKIITQQRPYDVERKLCSRTLTGAYTTALIYPGSSGSPAVNLAGQVVGVAASTDVKTHWGSLVPLDEVRDFLAGH